MKTNILKIGITGGIGAGKTTVSKIFSLLGIPVYYADERAKYILQHNEEVKQLVTGHFGEKAYKNGKLNNSFLSKEVFNNDDKLAKLNSFVHPQVKQDFEEWVKMRNSPYILKEAALLYEAGSNKDLDKIIVVFSPIDKRIKRILTRDPDRTEASIKSIMQKQMPDDEKVKIADYVIYNDDTQLLIPQVIKLHQIFTGS
jgi:dephospho-CoA kinase